MFFSSHKIGGPFSTGLLCVSNKFWVNYLRPKYHLDEIEERRYTFSRDLQLNGTLNVAGFMAMTNVIRNMELPNLI